MAEQIGSSLGEIDILISLLTSSPSLQIAIGILVIGLIALWLVNTRIRFWTRRRKFSYDRPLLAEFVRRAVLPFLALALISSINGYIQTVELFNISGVGATDGLEIPVSPLETFSKLLYSINILVIVFTITHLMVIIMHKRNRVVEEKQDFSAWREMSGFEDDKEDLFHKCFKWIPPKKIPDELTEKEFKELLSTKEGRNYLEGFTTSAGVRIGSYEKLVKDPFNVWQKSEKEKYEKYYASCVSGENQSGRQLLPGRIPDEIFEIDVWKEEKRLNHYEPVLAGEKPPGYAQKKAEGNPKSFQDYLPLLALLVALLGIAIWWGVDLVVLATASGGLAIGIGFALQETLQNYFAYVVIRKDKILVEGDRVKLPSGYNGIVHKITSRVTYVRHALNESIAIVPTRSLISSEVINFTKEFGVVPAIVKVGVSYLNEPRQVAAILTKVGKRALAEVKDSKGRHLAVQNKCPNIENNIPSCGCDKLFILDLQEPTVRFNEFNDSSLDFAVWVYVRDYGSQFKMKSDIRLMIYEEFKKYDIRIPWPIRTVYQSDEKQEIEEIRKLNPERNKAIEKYGIGDLFKGSED